MTDEWSAEAVADLISDAMSDRNDMDVQFGDFAAAAVDALIKEPDALVALLRRAVPLVSYATPGKTTIHIWSDSVSLGGRGGKHISGPTLSAALDAWDTPDPKKPTEEQLAATLGVSSPVAQAAE